MPDINSIAQPLIASPEARRVHEEWKRRINEQLSIIEVLLEAYPLSPQADDWQARYAAGATDYLLINHNWLKDMLEAVDRLVNE